MERHIYLCPKLSVIAPHPGIQLLPAIPGSTHPYRIILPLLIFPSFLPVKTRFSRTPFTISYFVCSSKASSTYKCIMIILSLNSVRCRVVRCCGFHDSSPSLPILCCSHSLLQCHPCRALDVLDRPWAMMLGNGLSFSFRWPSPVIIVLSSPFLRITCPKKRNYRLRTISRSISLFPILSKTHALVFLSVHGILRALL